MRFPVTIIIARIRIFPRIFFCLWRGVHSSKMGLILKHSSISGIDLRDINNLAVALFLNCLILDEAGLLSLNWCTYYCHCFTQ